ncbi:MAG: ABC transporter ATP-binding protein [Lachnospiraceae bacterium]|nr:ABC transporter ATP-binding protein [Lachnospiraceae bacterium]
MTDEKLVCSNITKVYGKKEVLKNVNLELEKGKIYGLIGRNGAGKTTLLSILSAQNPASTGMVMLGKEPVWENRKALNHICFSREINAIGANGQGNGSRVKDYLRAASWYIPNWDKAMADRLVKEFDLDVKKKVIKLSKGMLSMLTIIIALASKADYTFLDEPVAGLDVVMREYFYRILLEEFSESGRTFIVSTHIIEEASDVLEEVIMLDKGQIILKEDTQALLERARHVSGKEDVVDAATRGLHCLHEEKIGRSKGVTVLLNEGEHVQDNAELSVQPVNLQQVFVAMCKE